MGQDERDIDDALHDPLEAGWTGAGEDVGERGTEENQDEDGVCPRTEREEDGADNL